MRKLQTKHVAEILNVTGQRVIQLEQAGLLKADRTVGGIRLFERADVEKFQRKREKAAREKTAAKKNGR